MQQNSLYFFLCFLSILFFLQTSFANGSVKWVEGDPVGEPIGEFKQIGIEEEHLSFDVRPVEYRKPVKVKVVYRIHNQGSDFLADMIFLAPGAETGEIRINQQAVPLTKTVRKDFYPLEWEAINIYPRWNWSPYPSQYLVNFLFKMPFRAGENTLEVSYDLKAGQSYREFLTKYHINYALVPAKHWAYFRKLQVTLPPFALSLFILFIDFLFPIRVHRGDTFFNTPPDLTILFTLFFLVFYSRQLVLLFMNLSVEKRQIEGYNKKAVI
jgi:hypothetical protein